MVRTATLLVTALSVVLSGVPAIAAGWSEVDAPDATYADVTTGRDYTVAAGERMLEFGKGRLVGGAALTVAMTGNAGKTPVSIAAGTIMYRVSSKAQFKACTFGDGGCGLDDDGDGRFDRVSSFENGKAFPLAAPVDYQQVTDVRSRHEDYYDDASKLRRALIYQGSDGKSVKIGYREFFEGVARDAFTEDLILPIDHPGAPSQIAVKGFVLTVKAVGGMGMTYTVDRMP